jgi:hypothetical protein
MTEEMLKKEGFIVACIELAFHQQAIVLSIISGFDIAGSPWVYWLNGSLLLLYSHMNTNNKGFGALIFNTGSGY